MSDVLWYFSLRCKKAAGLAAAAFGFFDGLALLVGLDAEVGVPAKNFHVSHRGAQSVEG